MKAFAKLHLAALVVLLTSTPPASAAPGDRTIITVSSSGEPANRPCRGGSISGDGRFVAFVSDATNLDKPGAIHAYGPDVFLRDRLLKKTRRLTVRLDPYGLSLDQTSISGDGRYVAFAALGTLVTDNPNHSWDVYVIDQITGTISLESRSIEDFNNPGSKDAVLSPDGRTLCFSSSSIHLIESDLNNKWDIFCRDLVSGELSFITVSSTGQQGNGERSRVGGMSVDGRYVAFQSDSTNLVPGATSGTQIFLRDRVAGTTTLVSVGMGGAMPNNGSVGHLPGGPAISADGRFVAFQSLASNLVPGDTNSAGDIFVRDVVLGTTKLVTKNSLGIQQDGSSSLVPFISGDGKFISFVSNATNLVVGDKNRQSDGFIFDTITETVRCMGVNENGTLEQYGSGIGAISADGRFSMMGRIGSDQLFADELRPSNQIFDFKLLRSTLAGQNGTLATVQMVQPCGFGEGLLEVVSPSPLVTASSTIYLPTGTTMKSFPVRVLPVDAASVVQISVRYGNQSKTAQLTLLPLMPSAFEFTPHPVVGGNLTTARLVMNGVAGTGGKLVAISDNNNFCTTPATVTVPARAPQVVFTIATLPVTRTQYVTVTAKVAQGSKTGLFVIRP